MNVSGAALLLLPVAVWMGCPLGVAYAAQLAVVLALAVFCVRSWPRTKREVRRLDAEV